jgi:cytochrome c oxidase subunit III
MKGIQTLDLPREARSGRGTVFWAMLVLWAIEGTMAVSLITSYFYFRVTTRAWPPADVPLPSLGLAGLSTGVLVVSAMAAGWFRRTMRKEVGKGVWALGAGLVGVGGYLVLSVLEMIARPYLWNAHAYGSLVWTVSVYQGFHAVTVFGWGGLLGLWHVLGRWGSVQSASVDALAMYWYFVAVSTVFANATLYLAPYIR